MSSELPRQTDSLFKYGRNYRENFQLDFHTQENDYIRSFKEAADGVIRAAVEDKGDPSWRFLSACFLYRHYLELMLKKLIRRDCFLQGDEFDPSDWQSHGLPKLWKEVADLAERVLDDQYKPSIKIVGSIVNQFNQIDSSGQELRYAKKITLKGKRLPNGKRSEPALITPSLKKVKHKQVGIKNFSEVMERLDNFFIWVDQCIDFAAEGRE